jgi:DNA primase
MSKQSFIDFKAVKAAITMEQVLEHYGLIHQFKRSGDSLSGPCPIHKGSNPTQFRVSVSKNIWNCFSECKHGGNVLDFIVRMEKSSVHAAALKAIEWFHIDCGGIVSADSAKYADRPTEAPKTNATPSSRPASKLAPAGEAIVPNKPLKFRLEKLEQNHPYITGRGLTAETIAEFGIGFCAKGTMANHIAIPIHNKDGEVVAYAGRFPGDPPEGTSKYKLPQGFRKSLELFNINRAIKEPAEKILVIVEGFFGAIKLHQNGCRKVVALMGSSMSDAQEALIRAHTNRNSRVIVILDENEAGRTGREDTVARLARFVFVQIHSFEEEGKQPDSLTAEEIAAIIA